MSGLSYADEHGDEERGWDEGFAAKLNQGREMIGQPPVEPEQTEQPEPSPEPEGQPRNPDGTFAPADPEPDESPPEGEPEAPEPEPELAPAADDGWATFLTKYGVDQETYDQLPEPARKAIEGGFNAQKLVGSSSQEIAELRALVEERLPADDDEPYEEYEPPVDTSVAARKVQSHLERGEFREAAIEAYTSGMDDVFKQVRDAWADERPGEVADFLADVKMIQYEQRMQQQLAPFRQQQVRQTVNEAWSRVRREDGRSDLNDYSDVITTVAEELPEIGRILQGGNPQQVEKAIRALHDIARGRKGATAQSAAPHAAAQVQTEAAAAKLAAAVTSASTTAARATPAESQQAKIEEARAKWRGFLTEDPTNVMAGLTED